MECFGESFLAHCLDQKERSSWDTHQVVNLELAFYRSAMYHDIDMYEILPWHVPYDPSLTYGTAKLHFHYNLQSLSLAVWS